MTSLEDKLPIPFPNARPLSSCPNYAQTLSSQALIEWHWADVIHFTRERLIMNLNIPCQLAFIGTLEHLCKDVTSNPWIFHNNGRPVQYDFLWLFLSIKPTYLNWGSLFVCAVACLNIMSILIQIFLETSFCLVIFLHLLSTNHLDYMFKTRARLHHHIDISW